MVRLRLNKNPGNTGKKSAGSDKLAESIKRYLIWTTVIILTDSLTVFVTGIPIFQELLLFSKTLVSADLFVNSLSLLATYRKLPQILAVFFRRSNGNHCIFSRRAQVEPTNS